MAPEALPRSPKTQHRTGKGGRVQNKAPRPSAHCATAWDGGAQSDGTKCQSCAATFVTIPHAFVHMASPMHVVCACPSMCCVPLHLEAR